MPGLGCGDSIHQGGNSGYQAINLAFRWGAARIVLLGFDCSNGPDGAAHWFGQHAAPLGTVQPFALWQTKFPALAEDLLARGVDVANASRRTVLKCFRRADLAAEVARRAAPFGRQSPLNARGESLVSTPHPTQARR